MPVKASLLLESLEGDRSLIDRVRPGGCCQGKARMISEMFRAFGRRQPRDKCCERMHVPHLGLGNTRCCPGPMCELVGGVRIFANRVCQ